MSLWVFFERRQGYYRRKLWGGYIAVLVKGVDEQIGSHTAAETLAFANDSFSILGHLYRRAFTEELKLKLPDLLKRP